MLIVCPTCASEFTLEPERIGPTGRVVRCAKCRGAWFVPPLAAEADMVEPSNGARLADIAQRSPLRSGSPPTASTTRALVLALGLIAALGLAVAMRKAVVRVAPGSAVAFDLIGLPVNLVGLQLSGVASELVDEPNGRVLIVSGDIVNETDRVLPVPPLALTIQGAGGELLYNWTDRTDRGEIAPHDKRSFHARLSSPPPEGQRAVVAFSTKAMAMPVASR